MLESFDRFFVFCWLKCHNYALYLYYIYIIYMYICTHIGLVVRMSILDTEVDGSNPSISMFSP